MPWYTNPHCALEAAARRGTVLLFDYLRPTGARPCRMSPHVDVPVWNGSAARFQATVPLRCLLLQDRASPGSRAAPGSLALFHNPIVFETTPK